MTRVRFDTFARHSITHPFLRTEGVHNKSKDRYICPNCSGLTLTDTRISDPVRKFQTCPICAWHGPKEATLTLKEAFQKQTFVKDGVRYLR